MATEATAGSDFFSTTKDFSLGELAAKCGHSVRNLRAYMQLGVLHHGVRSGRETRYDETHLERLELVSSYRQRGYSLAAIADLLTADRLHPADAAPGAKNIIESWFRPTATYGTITALEIAFPQISSHRNLVAAAIERDLASLDGTDLTVHCPAALELGVDLLRQGVPLETALAEIDHLSELVTPIIAHALRVKAILGKSTEDADEEDDSEIVRRYILRVASMCSNRLEQELVIDLTD